MEARAVDDPQGCIVVVRRTDGRFLLLHRVAHGTAYEGEWAWTPPAGNRPPGEPVLPRAQQGLAEQTGIVTGHLWPVDLSGQWAVFATEVPDDVPVTLDGDHDRYEWLELAETLPRLAPPPVADGVRRAAGVPGRRLAFRPLTRDDLPQMVAWQRAPHAELWFSGDIDLATAEEKYGPRIDGASHVRVHVLLVDGQPQGFLQHYRVGDDEAYAAATGTPDALAIDYLIGDRRLIGRGLGPAMIWQFLLEVALPAHPDVTEVVASPHANNERSLRALDKAGFRRLRPIPTREPEVLCVFDHTRMLGPGRMSGAGSP